MRYNCNISPLRTKQKNRYKVAGGGYFATSENNILHKVAGYSQAFYDFNVKFILFKIMFVTCAQEYYFTTSYIILGIRTPHLR